MVKILQPIDLRKISTGNIKGAHTHLIQPSMAYKFQTNATNFFQSSEISKELLNIFTKNYSTPEVYVTSINECTIGPRMPGFGRYWPFIFGEFYAWNFLNSSSKTKYFEEKIFKPDGENILWEKNKVSSIKIPGLSIWFYPFGNLDHFFRECLPSIILLKELGINFNEINFICTEIKQPFYEFLIEVGIPSSSIIITGNRWIECEKLLLPCFGSFGHLHTPTNYYIKILDWILEKIHPVNFKNEKIYVSRNNAKMRRILNEHTLEPGLKKRGFHITEPGRYSIKEQIYLFGKSSMVVGPHGMGIANCGFSRSKFTLFEIMQSNYPRVSYYRTCQLKEGNYSSYWVAPLSLNICNNDNPYGDILIDKNKFFSALDLAF